jgi:hypothetical protein
MKELTDRMMDEWRRAVAAGDGPTAGSTFFQFWVTRKVWMMRHGPDVPTPEGWTKEIEADLWRTFHRHLYPDPPCHGGDRDDVTRA